MVLEEISSDLEDSNVNTTLIGVFQGSIIVVVKLSVPKGTSVEKLAEAKRKLIEKFTKDKNACLKIKVNEQDVEFQTYEIIDTMDNSLNIESEEEDDDSFELSEETKRRLEKARERYIQVQ